MSLTLAPANLLGGGFGALKIQIAYGNTGTFLRCRIANLLSDATAAAGDHDASILKAHSVLPLPSHRAAWQRRSTDIKGRNRMRLAGKVAIVTGAASGMGAATARMFAREGAKVVIADVMEHEGRQIADAIGSAARFEKLDVTNEENWVAVVAATTGHFGKLDVLVNNAGVSGSAEQDCSARKPGTASWRSTRPGCSSASSMRSQR